MKAIEWTNLSFLGWRNRTSADGRREAKEWEEEELLFRGSDPNDSYAEEIMADRNTWRWKTNKKCWNKIQNYCSKI
jgi:hypothetical protein